MFDANVLAQLNPDFRRNMTVRGRASTSIVRTLGLSVDKLRQPRSHGL